jgi:D-lactate dehydrogenase (cytochrome)
MLIKTQLEELRNYLEDTSNLKGCADALYVPQSKEEISSILEECRRKDAALTVSSGHTGTTGGCVPLQGAILSTELLKKIIDIDRTKKTATVESGVTLEDLEKEAKKFNLTLRACPTESLAFIGGAISTAASGVRGFGYGSIRKYVVGLEVVLADGELLNISRGEVFSIKRKFDFEYKGKRFKFSIPSYTMPAVKSQAGYFIEDSMDLIDVFIGSEGTLGVIISAQIVLQKIPFNTFDGLVFFKKEKEALSFAVKIKELQAKGLLHAASLEFFDTFSLEFLRPEHSFIPSSAAAAIYFEQEADNAKSSQLFLEQWALLIEEGNALVEASILADTPQTREKIFEFRHRLPQRINEFLRSTGQLKAATDIAVPNKAFLAMYNFYRETAQASALTYVNFGHIGESHLHFNFLPKNDEESARARECLALFCKKAVEQGGTVSAEHGIGKIKKPYLKMMYTQQEILEMAALKKYFDPHCLLGLDNIFNKELLIEAEPRGTSARGGSAHI